MLELGIVVPTFNERDNIAPLVAALDAALAGIAWEVLFVDDDSPDGTAHVVRDLAQHDPRVRILHRVGARGLASACIDGMQATSAPVLAVLDADMQHDETLLPAMLARVRSGACDLVIGSRYMAGGSAHAGLDGSRSGISRVATTLARSVIGRDLSDPMSGFFLLRRDVFDGCVHRLYGEGFKILLDLVSSAGRGVRIEELPYAMRPRYAGTSKLDAAVALEYLFLLIDKRFGGWLPARFAMFVAVGATGVAVHMGVLALAMRALSFEGAQGLALLVAMTSNFALNNLFTYSDRRLRGRALWRGLLSFYLACGFGALLNFSLAEALFGAGIDWTLAGLAGAALGAVWNYAITARFTWRRMRANR